MSRRNCLPSWSPNVMILVLLIAALKNAIDRYRVDNAISSNVNVVSEDDLVIFKVYMWIADLWIDSNRSRVITHFDSVTSCTIVDRNGHTVAKDNIIELDLNHLPRTLQLNMLYTRPTLARCLVNMPHSRAVPDLLTVQCSMGSKVQLIFILFLVFVFFLPSLFLYCMRL